MDIANITSLNSLAEVTTTDDVVVNFDRVILDSEDDSYLEKHSMVLSDFYPKVQSFEFINSNFILNNLVPNPVQDLRGFEVRTLEHLNSFYGGSDNEMTLTRVFNILQLNDCLFKFDKEMYKVNTGDESFENFTPELETVLVSFRNMVISSKKFNIVFSATIPGYLRTMEGIVQSHRYFPFKIVNAGKLLFDKLTVIIPVSKEVPTVLKLYGVKKTDLIYELDLTQFNIFDGRYAPNVNDMYSITYLIKDLKINLRAVKYVKDVLYDYMVVTGLTTQDIEWARGDKLKLDSLSDAGHPMLSVRISGDKEARSIETMLEDMGEVGEKLRTLLIDMIVTDISEEVANKTIENYSNFISQMKDGFLDETQFKVLEKLIEFSCTHGTINEKLTKLNNTNKRYCKQLNCLELKFLNMRYALLAETIEPVISYSDYFNYDFGKKVGSRQKSITYLSNVFQSKLIVNRDYVNTVGEPLDINYMFEHKSNQSITDNTTELKQVSDDFRKED